MRFAAWGVCPAWLVLSLGLGAAGCFQEIDSRASSETAAASAPRENVHTVDLMTPPIGLTSGDEGETTADACEAVTFVAMGILRANCAGCHGGGPGQNLGQPPFDFVLDVGRLMAATSATVKDPVTMQPVKFLVPGDPDHSRLYVRMFRREMPPGDIVGLPNNPNRPTISDVSLIRQWITHCLGAKEDGAGGTPPGMPPGVVGAGGFPKPPGASGNAVGAAGGGGGAAGAGDPGGEEDGGGGGPADTGAPRPDAGASTDASDAGDGPRRRLDGGNRPG